MILKNGIIKKHIGETIKQEEFEMRLINEKELIEVVDLENYVYSKLPNKQVLYIDSYEDMLEDMKAGAKIIGIFNEENKVIAYRYLGFPGNDDRNLGIDINLPKQELDKVVHLETTVVHPDYRGNGLQSMTLEHAVPMIKDMGYRHLLCTVSPQNCFSLFNIMKNGLKIKALKKKYQDVNKGKEGLWRFILHRNLEPISLMNPKELFKASLADIERQQRLIKEGFIGYWLFTESKELSYVKFEGALV